MRCVYCGNQLTTPTDKCPTCGRLGPDAVGGGTTIHIGRSVDNEIVIPDQHVGRRHVAITLLSGIYTVRDLDSRNGTFVNGAKVSIARVSHADKISLGSSLPLDWSVIISAFSRVGGSPAAASPGYVAGKTYKVGRASGNAVVIDGPGVSREHAEITVEQGTGRIFIRDLGSRNGTMVNGSPCQGKQLIGPNDVVTLGTSSQLPWYRIQQLGQEQYVRKPGVQAPLPQPDPPQEAPIKVKYDIKPVKINPWLVTGIVSVAVILVVLAVIFTGSGKSQRNTVITYTQTRTPVPGEPNDIAVRRARIEAQRALFDKAKATFPNNNGIARNYCIFIHRVDREGLASDGRSVEVNLSTEMNKADYAKKDKHLSKKPALESRIATAQVEFDGNFGLLSAAEANLSKTYDAWEQSRNPGFIPSANTYDPGLAQANAYKQQYDINLQLYTELIGKLEGILTGLDDIRVTLNQLTTAQSGSGGGLWAKIKGLFHRMGSGSGGESPLDGFMAWQAAGISDKARWLDHYESANGSRALAEKHWVDYSPQEQQELQNLTDNLNRQYSAGLQSGTREDFEVALLDKEIARIYLSTTGIQKQRRNMEEIMGRMGLSAGDIEADFRKQFGVSASEYFGTTAASEVFYMRRENGRWKRYLYQDDHEKKMYDRFDRLIR